MFHLSSKILLWQTSNGLIILRFVCAFLTQRLTENEFIRAFDKGEDKRASADSGQSLLFKSKSLYRILEDEEDEVKNDNVFSTTAEEFLHSLVSVIVDLPVK